MKLTLVSVHYRGRSISRFINAEVINGKSVVPTDFVQDMARALGARDGETFSIG